MTKLEFILSGNGSKKERCIYAAFCLNPIDAEIISNYYNIVYTDFPFPHICMDIIKKEYGKYVNKLSGKYIKYLLSRMIQTVADIRFYKEEISITINEFMHDEL